MRPTGLAIAAAFAIAITLLGCGGDDEPSQDERSRAIAEARDAYEAMREAGVDLEAGPCILDSVEGYPDWVADIAHDPRQPVDDDPVNQCPRYREGEASHFVELTPDGEVIRAE